MKGGFCFWEKRVLVGRVLSAEYDLQVLDTQ